jgi:hypothetical protein
MVPLDQLAQHNNYCLLASEYDMKLTSLDMKLNIFDSEIRKVRFIFIESPDMR